MPVNLPYTLTQPIKDPSLLKKLPKSLFGNWGGSAVGGIVGAITAFYGSIGFSLFIMEESIQAAGFGMMILTNNKQWERARDQLEKYRILINSMGALISKVDRFFGLKIDLNELTSEERDLVGPFLDETGALGRDLVLEPFIHFYNASANLADAYEARISSNIIGVKDTYKIEYEEQRKKFELDIFKLKQAHDERLDAISIYKMKQTDELQASVKEAKSQIAAQKKAKTITAEQAAGLVNAVIAEKNNSEILIKDDVDDRMRAEAETHFNAVNLMESIQNNEKIALRMKHFPPASRAKPGGLPESFTANVNEVIDGDTFKITGDQVRLVGIDAPEKFLEEGILSKKYLESLILNKSVTILSDKSRQIDAYGRILAVVMLGTANINVEMVKNCHAYPFLIETNSKLNPALITGARNICITQFNGVPQIPGVAPIPTQPPPTLPPPLPKVQVEITIIAELENKARLEGLSIFYDTRAIGTDANGFASFLAWKNEIIDVTFRGPIGYVILPTMRNSVDVTFTPSGNETHTFILRKAEQAPPIIPGTLPGDANNFTGLSPTVEFGLLSPVEIIGSVRPAEHLGITGKREFKSSEVLRTDVEILAVRVNIDQKFTNTEVMDLDYQLFRPDGTALLVPESSAEKLSIPSSRGFAWWNWAKFAAVFNGLNGDLKGTGIYKLVITADTGGVLFGNYTLFFRVS